MRLPRANSLKVEQLNLFPDEEIYQANGFALTKYGIVVSSVQNTKLTGGVSQWLGTQP
jgi:hypothetical protein